MTLTSNTTIKAAAFKSGYNPSAVAAATFTNSITGTTGTGKTYYVATNGSDSTTCTQAQNQSTPKRRIAAGVACLTAGDTLYVRSGTYDEHLDSNVTVIPSGTSWSNPVTIAAYGNETVTIMPLSQGGVINIANSPLNPNLQYIIFRGLIFDGSNGDTAISVGSNGANHIRFVNVEARNAGAATTSRGTGVFVSHGGSFIEFINGSVHDNGKVPGGRPPDAFYGFYVEGTDCLVEGTRIFNNGGYGIHNYSGYGSQYASRNTYRYNYIHDNGAYFGQNSAGLLLTTGTGNIAYGNVIYNNSSYGLQVGDATVYNNTVTGNTYGVGIGNQLIFKNNIVYGNTSLQFYVTGGNSVTYGNNLCSTSQFGCATVANPSFTDPTNSNYNLQPSSPAINAGTSSIGAGATWPYNGTAPDIGALESMY